MIKIISKPDPEPKKRYVVECPCRCIFECADEDWMDCVAVNDESDKDKMIACPNCSRDIFLSVGLENGSISVVNI